MADDRRTIRASLPHDLVYLSPQLLDLGSFSQFSSQTVMINNIYAQEKMASLWISVGITYPIGSLYNRSALYMGACAKKRGIIMHQVWRVSANVSSLLMTVIDGHRFLFSSPLELTSAMVPVVHLFDSLSGLFCRAVLIILANDADYKQCKSLCKPKFFSEALPTRKVTLYLEHFFFCSQLCLHCTVVTLVIRRR